MIDASDFIPFGEWLPDLGSFNNTGSLVASNCLTEGDRYKPFASLLENSDALPSGCVGGFAYRDAGGNVTIFAGTKTKLYKLNGLAWDDVTRASGGDYTTAEDGFWHFVNFGTLVCCTNYNDDIQVFDMGSSTEFEQLSATAPRARWLMVLSNFLVAGDTVDGDGAIGYRVKWGPILDPRGDWTPDPTVTQADFQDLYGGDYSNTAGLTLTDYGLIIQGKAIWRMQYQGGASIFSIEKVEEGRGSVVTRSCITDGARAFYYGEDGYYMHMQGQSIPIGNKKWDKTLRDTIDASRDYKISSSIDARNKVVMMSFPSIASIDGMCDKIFVYNWADERATLIDLRVELLFTYLSVGYTLEGIDALYSDLDSIPFSLDSAYWVGGKTILGAFSENSKLGSFTGSPMTATLGTAEIRPNNSGKTTMYSIIPYIEGGTKTARLGTRDRLNENPFYTSYQSPNAFTDEFDFTRDAVFHRAEMQLADEWTIAHGIAIRAAGSGNI